MTTTPAPRSRATLVKTLTPRILVGKNQLSKLNEGELAHLVDLAEACDARQLSITLSGGNLVGLKARINKKHLAGSLAAFKKLKTVFLYWGDHGPVTKVDDDFFDAPALVEAGFQNGVLTSVPPGLLRQKKLQELTIHGAVTFPENVKITAPLKTLRTGLNSEVPSSILELSKLESLFLGEGKLTSLPGEIRQMKGLKSLAVVDNRLTALPESIGDLTNLESLILSRNKLKEVPSSVGKLKKLVELQVNDNALKSLPDCFGKLPRLKIFVLSNNKQLKVLPASILALKLPRTDQTTAIVRQRGLATDVT